MRRWFLGGLLLAASLAAADLVVARARGTRPVSPIAALVGADRPPIAVGLIHSQTGPLAISELSLLDSERMALEEINAKGGISGRRLRWEVVDGKSDAPTFATQAARLIDEAKVDVLAGGWTAECRKALMAVVEAKQALLIFPANFEGIESSPNVVYSGGSANQVVLPAVRWCFDALKARRFFVVGTEEVWSRVVAEMAKDGVKAAGCEVAGESYLPLVGGDAEALVGAIRAAGPDVVLNMLVGDSNLAFYAAYRRAGMTPERMPIVAFNVAEDELRRFPPVDVAGHYAGWSYFQGVDRPENVDFVRRFKARYGPDRVVSDAMVAAYNGLMIWARAVEDAGSADPQLVMTRFDRQSFDGPEGIVTIDPATRVAWRPFFMGKARADGQFDVVWSITKPIHPNLFVATRSKAQWLALVEGLRRRWGGRWSSSDPARAGSTTPGG